MLNSKENNENANIYKLIKAKALFFLSKREYSERELFNKLQSYTQDCSLISLLIAELIKSNYLSNERYIKAYIRSKSCKVSLNKIRRDLLLQQLDSDLINTLINEFINNNNYDTNNNVIINLKQQDHELAYNLLIKKFKIHGQEIKSEYNKNSTMLQQQDFYKLRNKQIRYLQYKGFSMDTIQSVLKSLLNNL